MEREKYVFIINNNYKNQCIVFLHRLYKHACAYLHVIMFLILNL